jgi:hypothetical protein
MNGFKFESKRTQLIETLIQVNIIKLFSLQSPVLLFEIKQAYIGLIVRIFRALQDSHSNQSTETQVNYFCRWMYAHLHDVIPYE